MIGARSRTLPAPEPSSPDTVLDLRGVGVTIGDARLVEDVTVAVRHGHFVGLCGPNGSGKSTLLRTAFRVLEPTTGAVWLDGVNLRDLSARQVAQRMGVVLQERSGDFDFIVEDLVLMGRSPHKSPLDRDTAEDRRIVGDALARVGTSDMAARSFSTLSGGEKQRVLIARALAQQATVLVLDEPTNHLDIRYQLEVMDLLADLGVTVVTALHDLNLAAAYCDHLYVLAGGRLAVSGPPDDILSTQLVHDVFGVRADVITHPTTGRRQLVYTSTRQGRGDRHEVIVAGIRTGGTS